MSYRAPVTLDWATYGDSLAHRVRYIRQARGLTQEQLADRIGMHRNQVSNIERNASSAPDSASDPHLSVVYRLASALDVTPVDLMPDAGAKVQRRSPEQASNAAVSRVESRLRELLEATTRQ